MKSLHRIEKHQEGLWQMHFKKNRVNGPPSCCLKTAKLQTRVLVGDEQDENELRSAALAADASNEQHEEGLR